MATIAPYFLIHVQVKNEDADGSIFLQEVAESGLWNKKGLNGKPLSDVKLERVKLLVRFGNSYKSDWAY